MANFTLRLKDSILEKIDSLAEISKMSRNAYIEHILDSHVSFDHFAIGWVEIMPMSHLSNSSESHLSNSSEFFKCKSCGSVKHTKRYIRVNPNGRILKGFYCEECVHNKIIVLVAGWIGDGITEPEHLTDEQSR